MIGLNRPKDVDGQRYIAVGGKSDLNVLKVSNCIGEVADLNGSAAEEIVIEPMRKYRSSGKKNEQLEAIQWNPSK